MRLDSTTIKAMSVSVPSLRDNFHFNVSIVSHATDPSLIGRAGRVKELKLLDSTPPRRAMQLSKWKFMGKFTAEAFKLKTSKLKRKPRPNTISPSDLEAVESNCLLNDIINSLASEKLMLRESAPQRSSKLFFSIFKVLLNFALAFRVGRVNARSTHLRNPTRKSHWIEFRTRNSPTHYNRHGELGRGVGVMRSEFLLFGQVTSSRRILLASSPPKKVKFISMRYDCWVQPHNADSIQFRRLALNDRLRSRRRKSRESHTSLSSR